MQPLINIDLHLCGRNLLFEHLEQMILLLLGMNPTITGSQREHLTAISIPAIVPANMAMPNVQSTFPNLATCAVRLFYRKDAEYAEVTSLKEDLKPFLPRLAHLN